MGIFSRIGEIVNANINAMLDKAEDPVKMVKLMIHEMEDTLMEIKSSAAEVIAEQKRLQRNVALHREKEQSWASKAELAVAKSRDDLAREALEQKIAAASKAQQLEERRLEVDHLVEQYRTDITRLEEKLQNARLRQSSLEDRHRRAQKRNKVEQHIYQMNASHALHRFDDYESRMERLAAEAEVASLSNEALDKRFEELEHEGDIEAELEKLKQGKRPPSTKKKSS